MSWKGRGHGGKDTGSDSQKFKSRFSAGATPSSSSSSANSASPAVSSGGGAATISPDSVSSVVGKRKRTPEEVTAAREAKKARKAAKKAAKAYRTPEQLAAEKARKEQRNRKYTTQAELRQKKREEKQRLVDAGFIEANSLSSKSLPDPYSKRQQRKKEMDEWKKAKVEAIAAGKPIPLSPDEIREQDPEFQAKKAAIAAQKKAEALAIKKQKSRIKQEKQARKEAIAAANGQLSKRDKAIRALGTDHLNFETGEPSLWNLRKGWDATAILIAELQPPPNGLENDENTTTTTTTTTESESEESSSSKKKQERLWRYYQPQLVSTYGWRRMKTTAMKRKPKESDYENAMGFIVHEDGTCEKANKKAKPVGEDRDDDDDHDNEMQNDEEEKKEPAESSSSSSSSSSEDSGSDSDSDSDSDADTSSSSRKKRSTSSSKSSTSTDSSSSSSSSTNGLTSSSSTSSSLNSTSTSNADRFTEFETMEENDLVAHAAVTSARKVHAIADGIDPSALPITRPPRMKPRDTVLPLNVRDAWMTREYTLVLNAAKRFIQPPMPILQKKHGLEFPITILMGGKTKLVEKPPLLALVMAATRTGISFGQITGEEKTEQVKKLRTLMSTNSIIKEEGGGAEVEAEEKEKKKKAKKSKKGPKVNSEQEENELTFLSFRNSLRNLILNDKEWRIDIQRISNFILLRRHLTYYYTDIGDIGHAFETLCTDTEARKAMIKKFQHMRNSGQYRGIVKGRIGEYALMTSVEIDLIDWDVEDAMKSIASAAPLDPSIIQINTKGEIIPYIVGANPNHIPIVPSNDLIAAPPMSSWRELKAMNRTLFEGHSSMTKQKKRDIWLQCYLAGIPKVLIGLKSPGEKKYEVKIEELKQIEVDSLCSNTTKTKLFVWLEKVLKFIAEQVEEGKVYKLVREKKHQGEKKEIHIDDIEVENPLADDDHHNNGNNDDEDLEALDVRTSSFSSSSSSRRITGITAPNDNSYEINLYQILGAESSIQTGALLTPSLLNEVQTWAVRKGIREVEDRKKAPEALEKAKEEYKKPKGESKRQLKLKEWQKRKEEAERKKKEEAEEKMNANSSSSSSSTSSGSSTVANANQTKVKVESLDKVNGDDGNASDSSTSESGSDSESESSSSSNSSEDSDDNDDTDTKMNDNIKVKKEPIVEPPKVKMEVDDSKQNFKKKSKQKHK